MKKLLLAFLLLAGLASAQIINQPATSIRRGATLPSNCRDGQVFFVSNTGAYQCIAGVWTVIPTSSSGTAVAAYTQGVSGQTSVSILATTHGQGTNPVAYCFDNASPANAVACNYTRNASGDLVFTFSPAFTGTIEVGSGGGSVSGSGNPAGTVVTNAQCWGASNTFGVCVNIIMGTDNTTAGTLQLANSAANAHTIFASGATTTNTIKGFAVVPTTGHLIDCTVSSTTCLFHDSGIATSAVAQTIALGSTALDFASTATGACATLITVSTPGVLTTDTISFNANASIRAVTGYVPAATGGFSIAAYPTADNINFEGCNWTAGTVDPGSITVNYRVSR